MEQKIIKDKYGAVWVSHSSIGDFLKCPRAYYLHNMYKSKNNRKINLVSSVFSLGSAVHETLEGLARYKAEDRFKESLTDAFEENWKKVSGKIGGFKTAIEEAEAKERARQMIERVVKNPGPLLKKTIKLKGGKNNMPPNFFLSEEDNIILCGKIDWLEYIEEDDSVRVIDFKTGKNEEGQDSLQLPIYVLLLNALQNRKITGAYYWYLDRADAPSIVALPKAESARGKVLSIAKKIKEAREIGRFECPKGMPGCFSCQPYEKILKGKAEFVGIGGYNQELYLI
ncbi:MAG: PD-(D/E)XK nuclease family protein [Candidatus Nealsonbacteria bacterium]|nr:PD-(D/E)XK nuclease family protein [Candidatus Nealsonbacteria bacterium]